MSKLQSLRIGKQKSELDELKERLSKTEEGMKMFMKVAMENLPILGDKGKVIEHIAIKQIKQK